MCQVHGDSDRVWWQGALVEVKAHAEHTGGAIGIVEGHYWEGFSPPLHIHRNEDEAWFILDGRMKVRVADHEYIANAGELAFAPRDVPHSFMAMEGGVRVLVLVTPGGLEQMFLDGGIPIRDAAEQPPARFDMDRLPMLMRKYGCETIGPPLSLQ